MTPNSMGGSDMASNAGGLSYIVECEDGFSTHEDTIDLAAYRELVQGYPQGIVENTYWMAYGGREGLDQPMDIWTWETFERYTEQDFVDGPDAWLMPLVEDHNITGWRTA